jgi:DNA polymerase-3 subunit epsilon
VHGLTREDLLAQPRFAQVAGDFLDYIRGAEIIIHNADFDVEFLNLELGLLKLGRIQDHAAKITDTLRHARELHPGKRNSLDALCERYAIDHSNRTLHGALLDARLLAECYLAMTRGQETLGMDLEAPAAAGAAAGAAALDVGKLVVHRASPEEIAAHEKYLDAMEKDAKGPSLWRRILGMA